MTNIKHMEVSMKLDNTDRGWKYFEIHDKKLYIDWLEVTRGENLDFKDAFGEIS